MPVVSTDPPYYDNISYADLSDFFYVWLRHALQLLGAYPRPLHRGRVQPYDRVPVLARDAGRGYDRMLAVGLPVGPGVVLCAALPDQS